jgi:hypothetical protein
MAAIESRTVEVADCFKRGSVRLYWALGIMEMMSGWQPRFDFELDVNNHHLPLPEKYSWFLN